MVSIRHIFHIDASIELVYDRIRTIAGLKEWWTINTQGEDKVGKTIELRFQEDIGMDFLVEKLEPFKIIKWKCTWGHPEWIGTEIQFLLSESEEKVRVEFNHNGWEKSSDFYASCNFSWARYFLSLRQLCEKGKGEPFMG